MQQVPGAKYIRLSHLGLSLGLQQCGQKGSRKIGLWTVGLWGPIVQLFTPKKWAQQYIRPKSGQLGPRKTVKGPICQEPFVIKWEVGS